MISRIHPEVNYRRNNGGNFSRTALLVTTIAFFFTTISEFYYESPIGFLRIFEFLGVGIFIVFIFFSHGNFFQVKSFIFCMLSMLMAHMLPLWIALLTDPTPVYWNTVVGMPMSMAMTCIFLYVFSHRETLFLSACKYTLYIHLFFYYVQFLVFLGTGTVFNYLNFLGREQRMIGGSFREDTLIRCAGLTGEPAAFSIVIMTLVSIVCWGEKKVPWLLFSVAIIAVLLSFSAMGYFYIAAFFFCFFAPKIKSIKTWLGILIGGISGSAVAVALASDQIRQTYEKLLNFQESGSYQYRIGTFISYAMEDFDGALFGRGLGTQREVLLSDGLSVGAGATYSTVFLSCGLLLGGLAFFSIFHTLRRNSVPISACVFTFALFMGTHTPSQLCFWAWIFGLALVCRARMRQEQNFFCNKPITHVSVCR